MRVKIIFVCTILLGAGAAFATESIVEKGKAIVEENGCIACHAPEGAAKPLGESAKAGDDQHLRDALLEPTKVLGDDTAMPVYEFTDEEIQAIIAYMRSLSTN
jgi:cytochrome c oxidase subunit 2